MSYTVSKRITVHYTDHDYRLIRNGNDVSVESIPVNRTKEVDINVNVNTAPFDHSVDNCGNHIGALTTSIVGFKTANVLSKQRNERAIVNGVTSGFTSMIDQNLTLQNVGVEADMHALASEMVQQCKELDRKHEVMDKDFNRIKERYSGLFDTINKEFNSRIKQLIKPCFEFEAEVRKEQNRRIGTNLLSMATTGGKECDTVRIALQSSKMKENAYKLITCAKDYVMANKSSNQAKKSFLVDGGHEEVFYSPVLVMIINDNSNSNKTNVYFDRFLDENKLVNAVKSTIISSLDNKSVNASTKSLVKEYFNQQLDKIKDGSQYSERIISLMNYFFNNTPI